MPIPLNGVLTTTTAIPLTGIIDGFEEGTPPVTGLGVPMGLLLALTYSV